ncbi:hypothetical protein BG454_03900 [Roseinatronobacter bogoriensis subsp. barguzinensis]|uniref:Uncharacterized protein n=1 Tax=Roseinatronobacter bogoriensis subsp. barguzinensis TaxID=441209 RepID=A0A2K8K6J9_9RHOB|nr:hypothetical protein BG454_03900 [Rhodobaca barguzinensis]
MMARPQREGRGVALVLFRCQLCGRCVGWMVGSACAAYWTDLPECAILVFAATDKILYDCFEGIAVIRAQCCAKYSLTDSVVLRALDQRETTCSG